MEESISSHKKSVDVGIIGAQNCMKKKIHFGSVAHVYSDAVAIAQKHVEEGTPVILGIEHQEQEALCDPYLIKYEG